MDKKQKNKVCKNKSWFLRNKFKTLLGLCALVLLIYLGIVFILNTTSEKLKKEGDVTVSSTLISDRDFIQAVKFGTIDNVKDMIDLGANPKAVDENGRNTLSIASMFRHDPEVVGLLVKNGVNVNGKDVAGYTPLMLAIIAGNSQEFIKALLNNGANVNLVNNSGASVLMVALGLLGNNVDLIKSLINRGANVNYKDAHKVTPLMVALKSSTNPTVINLLLQKGANPRVADDLGIKAYDILLSNDSLKNNQELIRKLK